MSNELLNSGAVELRDKIAAGKIKSVEATQAVFDGNKKI